jgi:hypothetical protein
MILNYSLSSNIVPSLLTTWDLVNALKQPQDESIHKTDCYIRDSVSNTGTEPDDDEVYLPNR